MVKVQDFGEHSVVKNKIRTILKELDIDVDELTQRLDLEVAWNYRESLVALGADAEEMFQMFASSPFAHSHLRKVVQFGVDNRVTPQCIMDCWESASAGPAKLNTVGVLLSYGRIDGSKVLDRVTTITMHSEPCQYGNISLYRLGFSMTDLQNIKHFNAMVKEQLFEIVDTESKFRYADYFFSGIRWFVNVRTYFPEINLSDLAKMVKHIELDEELLEEIWWKFRDEPAANKAEFILAICPRVFRYDEFVSRYSGEIRRVLASRPHEAIAYERRMLSESPEMIAFGKSLLPADNGSFGQRVRVTLFNDKRKMDAFLEGLDHQILSYEEAQVLWDTECVDDVNNLLVHMQTKDLLEHSAFFVGLGADIDKIVKNVDFRMMNVETYKKWLKPYGPKVELVIQRYQAVNKDGLSPEWLDALSSGKDFEAQGGWKAIIEAMDVASVQNCLECLLGFVGYDEAQQIAEKLPEVAETADVLGTKYNLDLDGMLELATEYTTGRNLRLLRDCMSRFNLV